MDSETRILPEVGVAARGPLENLCSDQHLGEFKGAVVNHVTVIQCQDCRWLPEEAHSNPYCRVEREVYDHKAKYEQEEHALSDETTEPEVTFTIPSSIAGGRKGFEQEKEALNDEILRLKGCGLHDRKERFEGPIANRVTTQDQDQDKGRLLEEAKRDLEAFKNAYYRAERDMRDLEGRYEKERQALNDEIRWLRECGIHCREERLEGVVIGHVATQCRCQGLLLGEAKRDLEALKKAHYKAERDMENLGERFERELQSANYEIRQLKAIVARERRVVRQQTPTDTGKHAIVREGTKTM